jgi:hypothetical protein
MHDDANLGPSPGMRLPLGVRERGCEVNQRVRSLFEAFGQRCVARRW